MAVPDWYARQYWEDVERESQLEEDQALDEYTAIPEKEAPESEDQNGYKNVSTTCNKELS